MYFVFPLFVAILYFQTIFAMDSIRAKLDDLMGPDRDGVVKRRDVTVSPF